MSSSHGQMPQAVMFHHFHDATHPRGQGSISADEFARLIDCLGRERILSPGEWLDRVTHGTLRRDDLCLTFDDSLRCQYDIAGPVLRGYGLTAFWFVYTSVMEGTVERLELYRHFRHTAFQSVDAFYEGFWEAVRGIDGVDAGLAAYDADSYLREYPFYSDGDRRFRFLRDEVLGADRYHEVMTGMMDAVGFDAAAAAATLWIDDGIVRELHRDGHEIGLHSHSHPTQMAALPPAAQQAEYARNQDYLTAVLGRAPVTMAHPCNSYSGETLVILQRLGIVVGFRANMALTSTTSLLEYPREDHANLMTRTRI